MSRRAESRAGAPATARLARITAVVVACSWLACAARTPPGAGRYREARFAVTAAVAGEIAECGCRSGPQGGLARRSALVDSLRLRGELVLLDAGDFSVRGDDAIGVSDSIRVYLAREGYRAAGVGPLELARGAAEDPAGPPFVNANLFRESGDSVRAAFRPYVLVPMGDLVVGVSSVIAPRLVDELPPPVGGFLVRDPAEAARAVATDMRAAGADALVLFAHVPHRDVRPLGRRAGFDVVVSSHSPPADPTHGVADGTVYVHPGDRGRYLAEVVLRMDAAGLAEVAGRTHGLLESFPQDVAVYRWVREIEARRAAAHRRELLEAAARARGAGSERSPAGSGDAACASCHETEHAHWRTTRHARAFETLVDAGFPDEAACVSCHDTSPGPPDHAGAGEVTDEPDGASASERRSRARGVACAACHAVPDGHPDRGAVPPVEPSRCRRCHDAENSPAFDPASYWTRILHRPAGGDEPVRSE